MRKYNDKNLHFLIGRTLRIGVILSMAFMFIGGVSYLFKHGQSVGNFNSFQPSKPTIKAIYHGIVSMEPKSVIYLGIVLLIGTPVMRVTLSAFSFALEKDVMYTVITLVVLLIIFSSILSGHAA